MTEQHDTSPPDTHRTPDQVRLNPLTNGEPVHPRWRIHPRRAAAVAHAEPRHLADLLARHPVLSSVVILLATVGLQQGTQAAITRPEIGPIPEVYFDQLVGPGGSVVSQLVPSIVVTAFVVWLGWWRALGFTVAGSGRHLYLLWMPVLTLAVIFLLAPLSDTVDGRWLATSGTRQMLTGYLEEIVVRGLILFILLRAWRDRPRGALGAVVVSSVMFGFVHYNNVLTGDEGVWFTTSQVVYASFLGIGFAAALVRTNTIWPLVLIHGLIDVISADVAPKIASETSSGDTLQLASIVLTVPLLVYGLVLVRRRRRAAAQTEPASATTASPV
ncbi:MAG: lysostaphin resistance A-like protein [Dermatophilaceae bacterium]